MISLPKQLIHVQDKADKTWLKVFYHNSDNGDWFTEEEDLLYINSQNRFSIFGFINQYFKIDGYYEFLLEYPEFPLQYNNWKQAYFPLDVSQSSSSYVGYTLDETCHCSWTLSSFGGYSRSSQTTETFLDASYKEENWWYTIGAKKTYSIFNNQFAGPVDDQNIGYPVSKVTLWIRITPELLRYLTYRSCCSSRFLPQSNLFIILFII